MEADDKKPKSMSRIFRQAIAFIAITGFFFLFGRYLHDSKLLIDQSLCNFILWMDGPIGKLFMLVLVVLSVPLGIRLARRREKARPYALIAGCAALAVTVLLLLGVSANLLGSEQSIECVRQVRAGYIS